MVVQRKARWNKIDQKTKLLVVVLIALSNQPNEVQQTFVICYRDNSTTF